MKSQGMRIAAYAFLMAVVFFLPACKGSSSETQPTVAVVKLSIAGTLPVGKKIGAINVTLTLAPGVTLKSTTKPPEPDAGVVATSGVLANTANLLLAANYTAPTSTQPGKVNIGIITVDGFDPGEFVTVNGDIAAGSNPTAADFSASIDTIADTDTNPLTGMTVGLTVDIR